MILYDTHLKLSEAIAMVKDHNRKCSLDVEKDGSKKSLICCRGDNVWVDTSTPRGQKDAMSLSAFVIKECSNSNLHERRHNDTSKVACNGVEMGIAQARDARTL